MRASKLFAVSAAMAAMHVIAHPISSTQVGIEVTSAWSNNSTAPIIAESATPVLQIEKRNKKKHEHDLELYDFEHLDHYPDRKDHNGDGDHTDQGEPDYVADPRLGPDDYTDVDESTMCLVHHTCQCPKRIKAKWKNGTICVFTLWIKCPKIKPNLC